jgi:predicted porin
MRKKLLASAIVAALASSSAYAQTGLTLYGNVDASVVSASGIGPTSDHRISFGEGNWAPSVWGVKGTEDLGGGMRAHFRLEGGYNSGNGAIANGGTTGTFSRMANVGISGPFGSFTAGLNLSPFVAAYLSTLGLAGTNFYVPALSLHRDGTVLNALAVPVSAATGGTDADPALNTTGGFFIPNSVAYSLPSELLMGATASVMYAFGGVPGDSGANRFVSGNVGYAFGDLNVIAAASDRDAQYRQYLVGASVPIGAVKLAASYVRFKPETGDATSTYTVGAQMNLMPNTSVGINYARNNGIGTPSIANISAVYALSKTTNIYAAFNRGSDGAASSYSGLVDAATSPLTLAQAGSSNAFIIGLQKGF